MQDQGPFTKSMNNSFRREKTCTLFYTFTHLGYMSSNMIKSTVFQVLVPTACSILQTRYPNLNNFKGHTIQQTFLYFPEQECWSWTIWTYKVILPVPCCLKLSTLADHVVHRSVSLSFCAGNKFRLFTPNLWNMKESPMLMILLLKENFECAFIIGNINSIGPTFHEYQLKPWFKSLLTINQLY